MMRLGANYDSSGAYSLLLFMFVWLALDIALLSFCKIFLHLCDLLQNTFGHSDRFVVYRIEREQERQRNLLNGGEEQAWKFAKNQSFTQTN